MIDIMCDKSDKQHHNTMKFYFLMIFQHHFANLFRHESLTVTRKIFFYKTEYAIYQKFFPCEKEGISFNMKRFMTSRE